MKAEFSMKDVMAKTTMEVTVKDLKYFRIKCFIGIQLIHLAAHILGIKEVKFKPE